MNKHVSLASSLKRLMLVVAIGATLDLTIVGLVSLVQGVEHTDPDLRLYVHLVPGGKVSSPLGPTPGMLFTVAYTDVGIDATDESIATAKIIIFIFN